MRPTLLLLPLLLSLTAAVSAQEPEPVDAPADEETRQPEPAANEPKQDSIRLLGSRFSIVAGVGMLWPTSSTTREVFGSNHLSPSIAIWSFRSSKGFRFSLDFNWRAYGKDADGEANIWATNAGVVWLGRHRTRDLIPYVALRAGPAIVDIPQSSARFGFGGALDAGVVLWRRLIVSGRYDVLTREAGFDLSSLSARVAIRVF
jgi:hypothetical protein